MGTDDLGSSVLLTDHLDLLLATDSLSGGGLLYDNDDANLMKMLRNLANEVYSDINQTGH